MKRIPVVGHNLVQRWSRTTRHLTACATMIVGLSAWAQNAVSTFVGTAGTSGLSNTAPVTFRFTNPSGVAVDSSGNLFIADALNNVIRKVTTAGVVTTFAGSATGVAGSADGTGTAASFTSPEGITIDSAGNLYVADSGNHAIRRITTGGVVTTLAGTAGGVTVASGYLNATGTAARFNAPLGISVDAAGANLYVADAGNNAIRQVVVGTGVVTTLAGSATGLPGSTNATGTAALFSHPDGVVLNGGATILYVADTFNHLIRAVTVPGAVVTTLAGSGTASYAEATGTSASFNNPTGIGISAGGNILVSDTLNHVIRSITTGGVTSLFAGTPNSSGTTDGLATSAKFNFPSGITADASNTYIVDTNNQTIRKISAATAPSISVPPANATVLATNTATFNVTASGNPPVSYQWQRSTDSGSTWNNLTNGVGGVTGATTNQLSIAGVTTAQTGNQFRVLVSNGVPTSSASTASSAATLTVTQAPTITSVNAATFVVGQANSFQIVATGSPAITYSAGAGFPSSAALNPSTGVITATPTDASGSPFTFTITASNGVGSPATQSFTLTYSTQIVPSLTGPTNQIVAATANTASFTVSATGSPAVFTYQWQRALAASPTSFSNVTDGTVGTLTFSGATTATLNISGITPSMNGDVFRAVVTNAAGPTTSAGATLTVLGVVPTISVGPSNATASIGTNASFTATAAGTPTPTLRWQRAVGSGSFTDLSDDATYSGTTTSTLTITSVTAIMNNDQFRLVATNAQGIATSTAATLTVTSTVPTFTTAPADISANAGSPATFTIAAIGSPTPTIRWQRQVNGTSGFVDLSDDSTFSGTTSNTLTIAAVTPSMNGDRFQAVATNTNGTTPSSSALLTVISAVPSFTTQPVNATVNVGSNATFTVVTAGNPTPTLRWQRQQSGTTGFVDLVDDSIYSGTTSATLTVSGVTTVMSGDQFKVVGTNASGSTPSNAATLIVNLGTTFSTFAGRADVPAGSIDGIGTDARFNSPIGIAVGVDGSIYVADTANHVIRKISPNGVVITLAGQPGASGSVDGATAAARFNSPQGVAVDAIGNVYVADTFNHTIRVIATSGIVSTLAGTANTSGTADGVGAAARFFLPSGIVVDSGGTVYVSDSGNHAIRRVQSNGTVSTFAGTIGVAGFVNATGTLARFTQPTGLAIDSAANLYVADSLDHSIRKITALGVVTTLAGTGNAGAVDASGTLASFSRPNGVAVDAQGNVYVADTLNSTIRKITPTGDVSTLAGLAGSLGSTDGAGATARFNQPYGVAVDANGNIYVADTRNNTIRRSGSAFAPTISTQPINQLAGVGANAVFTVVATGTPAPSYQWQRATGDSPDFFLNLTNDGTFSGVNTSQLVVNNVTSAMAATRYRVIVSNGVLPAVTSSVATLTIGAPPVFTTLGATTFQAQQAGSFTVTTTSTDPVTYSASGLPPWATINAATGVISGTPPDTSGSPFTVVITANNGVTATQTLTINVTPAVVLPSFTSQPIGVAIDQGQNTTLSVAVSGTPPFNYQWRRNGVAISGATNATLSLNTAQPANAGVYTVAVTNSLGTVVSNGATVSVNTLPVINSQPRAQVALAGSSVTFSVGATGSATFSYQWRKNGVPIAGATNSTLTLNSVAATDAANYDVQVTNSLGGANSSLAQLTLVTSPTAPVITVQPAARTALVGTSVTLNAGASGAPTPAYQWRKNGNNIAGATAATITFTSVQTGDAGNYDVVASNSAGTATTSVAGLTVITRSYAGIYFGTMSNGEFAMYVREDNTGVFLGYLPSSTAAIMNLRLTVNDSGQFSFSQGAVTGLQAVAVNGAIGGDGSVSGSLQGGASGTLNGSRAVDTGASAAVAGFYQAGSGVNSAVIYTIAGPNNQAFVVEQTGTTTDGGRGTVAGTGQVNVTTNRSVIAETILINAGTISGTSTGAVAASFSGASDTVLSRQRLVNISTRARVGTADAVTIAGFVISGEESKPVLIRAVGPTLGAAPFNVAGALTTPKLELFRAGSNVAIATNTGIGANRANIDAADTVAGAFALNASGADAAILTTLAPGNYTAVVSSTTTTTGVALVEVYDLSAPQPGQKLLNISTRASAGVGDNTLIAGFVVPPGSSKRVLVRGVGPGLAAFGLTGTLTAPTLTLFNGSATVAQNTNWATSADAAAITAASAQVGAFGLAANDTAIIGTLAPGNYTVQILGAGGATGVALIEVYELP